VITSVDNRRGASSLECVVAFTLLSSVLAFMSPLVVKHRRLVNSQRDYRLALDEVTNQLERLMAMKSDDVERAVEQMQASSFVTARLQEAALKGEVRNVEGESSSMKKQVTVSLTWEQRPAAPVTLTGWVESKPVKADRSELP